MKPYSVINALREYYNTSVGKSGEWQKFLRLLQQENESIHYGRRKYEIKWHNGNTKTADKLMRGQFIAGLRSNALQMKLSGKGQSSRQNVQGNHIRESANENSQKHTAGAG